MCKRAAVRRTVRTSHSILHSLLSFAAPIHRQPLYHPPMAVRSYAPPLPLIRSPTWPLSHLAALPLSRWLCGQKAAPIPTRHLYQHTAGGAHLCSDVSRSGVDVLQVLRIYRPHGATFKCVATVRYLVSCIAHVARCIAPVARCVLRRARIRRLPICVCAAVRHVTVNSGNCRYRYGYSRSSYSRHRPVRWVVQLVRRSGL